MEALRNLIKTYRMKDWVPLPGTQKSYRIWVITDGLFWYQRHEWKTGFENETFMDEWIPTRKSFFRDIDTRFEEVTDEI